LHGIWQTVDSIDVYTIHFKYIYIYIYIYDVVNIEGITGENNFLTLGCTNFTK